MKKYLFSLIVVILFYSNSTNALTPLSSQFMEDFQINYNYTYEQSKFKEIVDYTDPTLEKVTMPGNITVFYSEVKNADNSIIRSGEWFKLINGKQVNYKETIEDGYRTKNQLAITQISSNEFYIDSSKCQNGNEFINNNCKSKNKKTLTYNYYMGKRIKQNLILEFPNSTKSRDDAYTWATLKQDNNDKLEMVYSVSVKRDSANRIYYGIATEYLENKKIATYETVKVDQRNDLYDVNNVMSFGIKSKEYDTKGRVIKEEINYQTYENYVTTYSKSVEYYSNGKIYLLNIKKRNYDNKIVFNQMNKYNSKGIKRGAIKYNYKNGVITLRKEYIFNLSGKLKAPAYRYTTTYKKGKVVKTYRQSYNKKGKLSKKKVVKNRSDYIFEENDEEFYFF